MSEKNYPTPHISARPEDIAETVLMPGDPKRSEFVAKSFLENAVLFNDVRGVKGYTGSWKGHRVSVMASGMGMPSMGIYSYELYKHFGVQNIMRIGSAGAISTDVKLRDIVVGMGACTNSNFAAQYDMPGTVCPICNWEMLETLKKTADSMDGVNLHIGSLFSADTFYDDVYGAMTWQKMGCLAVEMEAAALYWTAMRLGMRALAICTISDTLYPPQTALDTKARETTFTQMMELALETAVKLDGLAELTPKD